MSGKLVRGYSSNSASSASSARNATNATTATLPNAASVRSLSPQPRFNNMNAWAAGMDENNNGALFEAFPEGENHPPRPGVLAQKTFSDNGFFLNVTVRGNSMEAPSEMDIGESRTYSAWSGGENIYPRGQGIVMSSHSYQNGLNAIQRNTDYSAKLKTNVAGWVERGFKDPAPAAAQEKAAGAEGGRRKRRSLRKPKRKGTRRTLRKGRATLRAKARRH